MLNPDIQSRSRLIFRLAAPIREWHGHGVSRQRSKEASGMYYAQQAQGECVDSLSRTFRQLSDLECLELIGLKCVPTPARKGVALDSAAVMSEDKLASEAGTFCLHLVNRRMQSMLGYSMGFPGLFALLIPNLPGLDQILLKKMREAAAAHRGMETAPQVAFVKQMLSRSVFQQSYVAMMFNLAAAASYTEVTEDMRALANAAFSVVGQTKVVEDAFNRCRKNEQHGGNGTLSMSDLRKYMTPVSTKVLEEVHHFETVDWRSTSAIDRGNSLVKGNLPSNMFTAPGKNMSLPLQLLVGKKPKAGWHSFSPSTSVALH